MRPLKNSWTEFEEKFGIQLPEAFKRAFDAGEEKDWPFELLTFEEISCLDDLTPFAPLRFLPVSHGGAGDVLGIYFPRGADVPPFAAIEYIGCCALNPISEDLEIIVLDSDQFDCAYEGEAAKLNLATRPEWESLVVNPNSEAPSAEFLKPFSLNLSMLDRIVDTDLKQLAERLVSIEPDSLAAKCFRNGLDISRAECWIRFAEVLRERNRPEDAIRALDNGHRMLFSHPHRGYPDKCPEERPADCELFFFQKMWEFSDHLDRLDRRVISFQCENYHYWMRRADEERGI